MSDEVLSQAEVESLLNAMENGPTEGPEVSEDGRSPRSREKITPYDFKRPERVGKEQMRALQSLHEGFGRNFGAALSALLRCIVEVKLTSVDQLTYSEFVFSLENPTCFNLLRAEPLDGDLILDINPSILYPVIDRLLGGGKESGPMARRPLTEIELRLVSRITDLFLEELRRAWENVLLLELSVDRVESNPQLVQIVPPNEVVVLISFELTLGEVRGMMNLCIPFNSIERISGKLTSNTWLIKKVPQNIKPRYNVAPSQDIPAILNQYPDELSMVRWGLIPSWAKEENTKYSMINAKAETIAEKPAYRGPIRKRRCLIPADSFYEWKKTKDGPKRPFRIMLKDQSLFVFAGVWDHWERDGKEILSCSIITTEPNELMKGIHDRMPVILPKDQEEVWLKDIALDEVLGLLKPYDADAMEAYEVSTVVNSPANDHPEVLQAI